MARFDQPFVALFPDQVRELGSIEAAAVHQFIAYAQGDDPDGVVLETQAIADGTGLSLRTVQRVAARLRDQGRLASERSSTWVPTLRWKALVSAGQCVNDNLAVSSPPAVAVSLPAKVAVTPLDSESREIPPLPPKGEDALPFLMAVPDEPSAVEAEFAAWWKLYPRKDDRKPALRAYRTARKSASAEALLDGLRAHLPAYTVMRADPNRRQYVPLGASWLNKERWLNEPPETAGGKPPRNAFVAMAGGDR